MASDGAPEGPVIRVGVKAVAEAVSVVPQVRHPLGSRLREVVVVLAATNEGAVVQEEDVVEDVGAGGPVLGPEPVVAEARVQVSVGSRRGRRHGQGRRQHAHSRTCPEPLHAGFHRWTFEPPSRAKPTSMDRATSAPNSSSKRRNCLREWPSVAAHSGHSPYRLPRSRDCSPFTPHPVRPRDDSPQP